MISAKSDVGKPIDWWFLYKVSGESKSSTNRKATGTEYAYFDTAMAKKGGQLVLSKNRVNQKNGALYDTLSQVYGRAATADKNLGWYFYNDENPINGKVRGSRGHTKGVLAFDLKTNSAFWLIQSTPLFPPKGRYSYPATGQKMAQTMLCVTLKDAAVAEKIAHQMNVA